VLPTVPPTLKKRFQDTMRPILLDIEEAAIEANPDRIHELLVEFLQTTSKTLTYTKGGKKGRRRNRQIHGQLELRAAAYDQDQGSHPAWRCGDASDRHAPCPGRLARDTRSKRVDCAGARGHGGW